MSRLPGADRIRRFLGRRCAAGSIPGAAWYVAASGRVISHGAEGNAARVPRPEPVRPDTPFDLASLTKPLATALLAVLLEQEGVVDLDAPAQRQLPELRGSPYAATTLLDLAVHRSGMPDWRPLFVRASSAGAYLERIASEPPAAPPGAVLYSDLGYIALGAALERAAGSALDRLFEERVAEPLGLRATGFAVVPGRFAQAAATEWGEAHQRGMAGPAAAGHRWRVRVLRGEVHDANAYGLGGTAGHAGLFGTAEEVARIAGEILAPRRLGLGEDARRRLLQPVAAGRTVGMVLAEASGAARGILPDEAPGHTGFTGTSFWLLPRAQGVVVLLTNRVHPHVPSGSFQSVRRAFHRVAVRSLAPLQ